ncbi:MAG: hypothetical protein KGZ39_03005 [Simkania sp.]|nr:hypothetical protein [Simkania sp.]
MSVKFTQDRLSDISALALFHPENLSGNRSPNPTPQNSVHDPFSPERILTPPNSEDHASALVPPLQGLFAQEVDPLTARKEHIHGLLYKTLFEPKEQELYREIQHILFQLDALQKQTLPPMGFYLVPPQTQDPSGRTPHTMPPPLTAEQMIQSAILAWQNRLQQVESQLSKLQKQRERFDQLLKLYTEADRALQTAQLPKD